MKMIRQLHQLLKNEDGVAALEFAIVAIPLFFLILGATEFGLMSYAQVTVEAALAQVARTATIGATASDGCDRASVIVAEMERKLKSLPNSKLAYVSAAVVTTPGTAATSPTPRDICLDGSNPYPATCPGSFIDNNGNGIYDSPANECGFGSAGASVEIRVVYPWRILTPFFGLFFHDGVSMINTTTVVRNEPLP